MNAARAHKINGGVFPPVVIHMFAVCLAVGLGDRGLQVSKFMNDAKKRLVAILVPPKENNV